MVSFFNTSLLILLLITLVSCDNTNDQFIEKSLSGTLIYNNSNNMYKYDLKTRASQLIYPNNSPIREEIEIIDKENYLIQDVRDGLYKINLTNKEMKFLRDGYNTIYIPAYKKIIFYAKENDQYKLFLADIDSPQKPIIVSNAPKTIKPFVKPVQISKEEFVFVGENDTLCTYNVITNIVKSTDISMKLLPIVWVKSINRLLCRCYKAGKTSIYLIDLLTKTIEEIKFLPDAVCIEYIESYDALIYSNIEYGFGGELLSRAKYNLFVYFLRDKKTMRIGNDLEISHFRYLSE